MKTTFEDLGRAAYEAYAKAQAKRSGRGEAIRPWEVLKAADQRCWTEAAFATVAVLAAKG